MISYETFRTSVNNEFGMKVDVDTLGIPYADYEAQILKDCPTLPSLAYGLLPNPPYVKREKGSE